MNARARGFLGVRKLRLGLVLSGLGRRRDGMPPDPHYALSLINHETGERLKIEMVDRPFPRARSYRILVNGGGRPIRQLPPEYWKTRDAC
jgi:hypothetical protein